MCPPPGRRGRAPHTPPRAGWSSWWTMSSSRSRSLPWSWCRWWASSSGSTCTPRAPRLPVQPPGPPPGAPAATSPTGATGAGGKASGAEVLRTHGVEELAELPHELVGGRIAVLVFVVGGKKDPLGVHEVVGHEERA